MCRSLVSRKNLNRIRTFRLSASEMLLALTVMLAFVVAGCSASNPEPEPVAAQTYYPPPVVQPPTHRAHEQGTVATWYGPGYAGHRTSTGEKFDPNALTAASKTLPLGSRVRVTNPDTGKSVVVRINDRLPHGHRRTIDLSRRAAEEIGITKKGVARVKVASVTGDEEEDTTSKSSSPAVSEAEETHHSRHRSGSKSHQQASDGTPETAEIE